MKADLHVIEAFEEVAQAGVQVCRQQALEQNYGQAGSRYRVARMVPADMQEGCLLLLLSLCYHFEEKTGLRNPQEEPRIGCLMRSQQSSHPTRRSIELSSFC